MLLTRRAFFPFLGGFLPWQSWERFLTSEVGNGGVLRFPKGQKSLFFDVEAARRAGVQAAQRAQEAGQLEEPASGAGGARDAAKER